MLYLEKSEFLKFKIKRLLTRLYDPYVGKTMYGTSILNDSDGGAEIKRLLTAPEPCMIGRTGCSEILAVNESLAVKLGIKKRISKDIAKLVCNNAGFFPNDDRAIMEFANEYIRAAELVDYFADFEHHHMDYFIEKYCPKTVKVGTLRSLEPYYANTPWTKQLKGKNVLVVHPFETTIRKQYLVRDKLYPNTELLPEFNLLTVKAVQSIGSNTEGFKDWFSALDYMKDAIALNEFDIAILGCGAYGFALASWIKGTLKKKSVVLGGATQILFGIKGARWENHPVISKLYNEYWVNPAAEEIPQGYKSVERGCYW